MRLLYRAKLSRSPTKRLWCSSRNLSSSWGLAAAGSLSLTVVNANLGGGSASASVPVNNPAPGTISLTPATLSTGATTVTTAAVNGSNFRPSSTIQVGTTTRATTYVSATQLTFQLTVADQATAVRLTVSVVTPTPGVGTSTIAYLTLAAPTLTPIITQASPTQFIAGSGQTTIAVFGANLTSTSVVQWNGTPLSTAYVTNTYYRLYLIGTVPPSFLTSIGTASITVSSPTATIPVSNALSVAVANPPSPTLTSLSSTLVPVNTATTLTLYGTNFTSATTVAVNGVIVPSTYSYSNQMTLTLPASAVLTPSLETITVSNG